MPLQKLLVYGCRGCGSAIAEAALALAGIDYDREEVDYSTPGPKRDRLLAVNPLGQVPALVLPGGTVLTETAAIVHYVDDHSPSAGLIPPAGAAERARFYRWLAFLVAAVYPTFTYGDEPEKWVGKEAGPALRASTDRHREALWRQVEQDAAAPWFLGERFSALDLYVAVMTRWRPGPKWFEANTPRLHAIAAKAAALPAVAPVMACNFG